jgi:hypothetical protein
MKILNITTDNAIWWNIGEKQPKLITLDRSKKIKLVNPFLYDSIPEVAGQMERQSRSSKSANGFLVCSPNLCFSVEEDFASSEEVFNSIQQILEKLRYVSKQSNMGRHVHGIAQLDIKKFPKNDFP